jgi:hypothetical protein
MLRHPPFNSQPDFGKDIRHILARSMQKQLSSSLSGFIRSYPWFKNLTTDFTDFTDALTDHGKPGEPRNIRRRGSDGQGKRNCL